MSLSQNDQSEEEEEGASENNNEDAESSSSSFVRNVLRNNKFILWIGSTTSIIVATTFFIVLAIQRNPLMVSFFVGSILNGILGKVLKKLFNQDRPTTTTTENTPLLLMKDKPNDKGMPSSHAMSLGFIGTFTGLTLSQTQIPILLYVMISLYYRVTTQLHTWEQVFVGLVMGIVNGIMWRSLCNGTNPLFPSINVMDWLSTRSGLFNDNGLLPIPLLVLPAIIGLIVVGSFERRIVKWIKSD